MNCQKCGNTMSGGAPHCETIKTQYECWHCGHIECEYYTPEEQKLNELVTRTSGVSNATYKECREALEKFGYNIDRAESFLNNKGRTIAPTNHLRHYYAHPADFEYDEHFGN